MADPNTKYFAYLKKLSDKTEGMRAVHLHLSQLPAVKRSRENLSRAVTAFNELRAKFRDGEVFLLKNLDVVFFTSDISKQLLAAVSEGVEQMIVGQASIVFTSVHGDEPTFFTILDLICDYQKLLMWSEENAPPEPEQPADEQEFNEVDLALIGHIKTELERIDATPFMSSQGVYHMADNGMAVPVFHEVYVSIQALEEAYCPGLSLTSRRWLFNDLTMDLDAAVLRQLVKPNDQFSRKRLSMNINLVSLSSPHFQKFDAALTPQRRSEVVLEINRTDFYEHMGEIQGLLPELRKKGFKLLLDGVSFLNLDAIDVGGLSFDFIKLFWTAETQSLTEKQLIRIGTKIKSNPQTLFILARCDTQDAVRYGQALGIHMVQGRQIDQMVKAA